MMRHLASLYAALMSCLVTSACVSCFQMTMLVDSLTLFYQHALIAIQRTVTSPQLHMATALLTSSIVML